jgi:hypothetical protein
MPETAIPAVRARYLKFFMGLLLLKGRAKCHRGIDHALAKKRLEVLLGLHPAVAIDGSWAACALAAGSRTARSPGAPGISGTQKRDVLTGAQ